MGAFCWNLPARKPRAATKPYVNQEARGHVLIDGIRIRNYLDVPNCDGIDPDWCRDMEIKNCNVVCADDGIVIKTSEQTERDFGSRITSLFAIAPSSAATVE